MTDPNVPVVPPADPPAPPPDPKPAEKKLLDELKKEREQRKAAEAKLAEAIPYVEKFKGHEDAKALEAQREAEARARQESESRARQEMEAKRERAILKSLLGVVPPGDDELAEFAVWKLSSDKSIVYDPETDSFAGLAEAREALKASPRFAGKTGEPPKKVAPGLPDTKGGKPPAAPPAKTYSELWQDPAAAEAYRASNPIEYEQLKRAHMASQSVPRSQVFPGPGVMK